MSDTPVTGLPAASALGGTELFYADQGGSDVKVTANQVRSFVGHGSPGGSNTQVQFNDSGSFGGNAGFTYDKSTNILTLTGQINVSVVNRPLALPGAYTLANSGLVFKNAAGDEIFRLWGTDPDNNDDFNSANLYIGLEAGLSQPTDNVNAGYINTGVGYQALYSITTGSGNSGFGEEALRSTSTGASNAAIGTSPLWSNDSGNENVAVGYITLFYNTSGEGNTAVGAYAGVADPDTDPDKRSTIDTNMTFVGSAASRGGVANSVPLTNSTAIGNGAVVTASNIVVIGNASVTDVYLGSDAGLASIHATTVFPGHSVVASLPSAASNQYGRRMVTDANSPTFGATVAGGGSTIVPVYSDGTNWKVG